MPRPILLASIGNPGAAYATTRHSAGHILLRALAAHEGAPPLFKDRRHWAGGDVSMTGLMAFWTSPSFMNECGPSVTRAYKSYLDLFPKMVNKVAPPTPNIPTAEKTAKIEARPLADAPDSMEVPHLVVIHDELELPLGKFKLKTSAGASHRGHNGLRSILENAAMRQITFSRLAVGIGPRPQSRDKDDVARFVLAKMGPADVERIEQLARPAMELVHELAGRVDVRKADPSKAQKGMKEKQK